MLTIQMPGVENYELIDSGEQSKLERFGMYTVARPDPNALWDKRFPALWKEADAVFHAQKKKDGKHWDNKNINEQWLFSYENVVMELHLTPFKHTGIFPEQIANWVWMKEKLAGYTTPRVLNLFGYTGGATLFCASHGAQVTHVDASHPSVTWARKNQELSSLAQAPIRWIVDDAEKFVAREIRRGATYDAVILDPPSFGRDPKGRVFKFEYDVPRLLSLVKRVLSEKPAFVLLNSYATGFSSLVLANMCADVFVSGTTEYGELTIPEKSGRLLPCGIVAQTTFS